MMRQALFILTASAILGACVPDIMNTKPEVRGLEGAAPVQTLTDPRSGTEAVLRPGGELRIKLDSNPTTGYFWELDLAETGAVELVSSDYIADPAPEGLVGSGGHQMFVFKAVQKGRVTANLSYQRSPEDVAEKKTIKIKVIE
jgi:inhibitor of cysteine peptidase